MGKKAGQRRPRARLGPSASLLGGGSLRHSRVLLTSPDRRYETKASSANVLSKRSRAHRTLARGTGRAEDVRDKRQHCNGCRADRNPIEITHTVP